MGKILKTALIALLCTSLLSGLAFYVEQQMAEKYNAEFPDRYISETYPGAEVIDSENVSTGWTRSTYYASSVCYDSTEDIYFTQQYSRARSGKLIPEDRPDPHNHERSLACRDAVQRCMGKASMLSGEYKAYRDPYSNSCFFIIMKYDGRWEIYDLKKALNDAVCEEKRNDPDIYISYRIILCGEDTYDRINTCGFFDKMDPRSARSANGCEYGTFWNGTKMFATCLEQNEGGGNEDLYRILLEAMTAFHSDIVLWISGEPNAVNQQKYVFYGVEYDDIDRSGEGV